MLKARLLKRHTGFTIVELLIVIVVIAILASITVVAFNGVQKRAQTTKYAAAGDAAIKLVKMYKEVNTLSHFWDGIADPPDGLQFCLAKTADLPATSEFAQGECVKSPGESVTSHDAAIDKLYSTGLMSYSAMSLPTVSIAYDASTTEISRGIYVYIRDTSPSYAIISWSSPDRSSCAGSTTSFSAQLSEIDTIIASGTTQGTIYSSATIAELKEYRDMAFGGLGDANVCTEIVSTEGAL